MKSGLLLGFVGLCAATAPLLPSIMFSTLAGLALMAAGWVRLRATSFTPLRQKSAIVPVSASISILIGVLLVTRWPGTTWSRPATCSRWSWSSPAGALWGWD